MKKEEENKYELRINISILDNDTGYYEQFVTHVTSSIEMATVLAKFNEFIQQIK